MPQSDEFQRNRNVGVAKQHLFVKVCSLLKLKRSENDTVGSASAETHPSCELESQSEADCFAEKLGFTGSSVQ